MNRWHDNVNSLFDEKEALDPSKNTVDVIKGSIGSYPNLFYNVYEDDVPDFLDMLKNFKNNQKYNDKFKKYAISRSDTDFWKYYDWFQDSLNKEDSLNSGLYDLNRYYREPWDKINN